MTRIYNMNDEMIDHKKFKNKHLAIFLGCDVPPNFIHLYIANTFNKLNPSEVSILLLTHNSQNHYYTQFYSMFKRLLKVELNIMLFDDALFNISIQDVPNSLWDQGITKLNKIKSPFRKISLYDVISTVLEPINLVKNYNVDYLFINPFLKELYNLQTAQYNNKFVYQEVVNLKKTPKLKPGTNLKDIDLEFLQISLIPFTRYAKLSREQIKEESAKDGFYTKMQHDYKKLLKLLYRKKKKELTLNVSGDNIVPIVKNFTSPSKIGILRILKSPKTLTQISKENNMAVSTIKEHLNEMEKEGIIARTINKKYYLHSRQINLKLTI